MVVCSFNTEKTNQFQPWNNDDRRIFSAKASSGAEIFEFEIWNHESGTTTLEIFILKLLIIFNFYRAIQNFQNFVSGQAISVANPVPRVPARLQILPPKTVSRPRIGSRPMCWSEITIKMRKYFENSFLLICNYILSSFIWIRKGLSILYEYFMTPKWVFLN